MTSRRARIRPVLEAQQAFKRAFGYQPAHCAIAPASLELLGSQAEANEGLALTVAIDRYVQIAAAPRTDGRVELVFPAVAGRDLFWVSDIQDRPETAWADPIKSVLRELRRQGVTFSGFSAAAYTNIPPDINSLAAWQAATAVIVRKLYPYRLTETGCLSRPPVRDRYGQVPPMSKAERLTIAQMCHRAASRMPGHRASWLDLASSLCGKSFHALSVDCRFRTVEPLPMIGQVVVIACPSGVVQAAAEAELTRRASLCHSAARRLHARNLRSVDLPYLSQHRMRLTEHEYACAYHIIGENQRVVFAERALHEDDFLQFGQYLLQSHESARDFFQNSCLELDLLVELAREQPGCIGARLSGAGFGGLTVNLVTWNQYEHFIPALARAYERHTGRRIQPLICQVVDGAE